MRFARTLAFAVPLLAATTVLATVDGIWTLRERFCVVLDGSRDCGPGREDLMFLGGTAYYRTDPADAWSAMGAVTLSGRRVSVSVDREGFGELVAAKTGVDVTPYLESFQMTYQGVLRGDRIVKGKIRATARLDVEGDTHQLRAQGAFKASRSGEAVAPPPDDEELFLEGARGGSATEAGQRLGGEPSGSALLDLLRRSGVSAKALESSRTQVAR